MDITICRLLSLLRHSLLGSQLGNSLFSSMTEMEWGELFDASQKQGVAAFVFTALNDLEVKPSKPLLLKWISLSLFIEKSYKAQKMAATLLARDFAKAGIRTLVLKGLAISQCYPKPYYRQCGDADIFLIKDGKSAFEDGNRMVEGLGVVVDRSYYKNSSFSFKGLHVENHHFCTQVRGSKKAKMLEKCLENMLFSGPTEIIGDTDLESPCAMFNALFLTEHAKNHFLREGISLRHICDWMMFRQKYADALDWKAYEEYSKEFGLWRFAQSMNHLADFIKSGNENVMDEKDRMLLTDVFSERVSTSSQEFSLKGRWILIQETLRANWKYRAFSDVSMLRWLWQSSIGYFFDKEPRL